MLVRAIGGEGELPDDAAEAIAIRSDGMPIFAEELTRGYIESAPRADAGNELSRIPATLAETILARLDRLVHGRKIASIAAAIEQEFPVALLVVVSGLTDAEVGAGIRELLDAEVMTPGHSPFGEAVSFRHMLLRDAAYGLLLHRERTSVHARIADTLSTSFPAIADALPNVMAIQRFQAGMFEGAARNRSGPAKPPRSAPPIPKPSTTSRRRSRPSCNARTATNVSRANWRLASSSWARPLRHAVSPPRASAQRWSGSSR